MINLEATSPLFQAGTSQTQDEGYGFLSCIKSLIQKIWNIVKCFFCGCRESAPSETSSKGLKDRIQQIAKRDGFVWFYKKKENPLTTIFGNFAPAKVQYNGRTFRNSEAAYQSEKYTSESFKDRFTKLDGQEAWQLGRKKTDNSQFNSIATMNEVVMAKFSQNKELKEILLATGDAYLVEHTPKKGRDKFWADDHDGSGSNWLGHSLMLARERLGGTGIVDAHVNYHRFVNNRS